MFAQYFGQFLLVEGLVSTSELEQAMALQRETRAKLGVLAIHRGYMTAEQVESVHQAQTRMDMRFGEIAVAQGVLSEAQVNELLSEQTVAHLALGQALIDRGALSFDRFAAALKRYKDEHDLSDEQFEQIAAGGIEPLLAALLFAGELSDNRLLTSYVNLFAKNVIRFVERDIRMEKLAPDAAVGHEWVARQTLSNADRSVSRTAAIGASEGDFLKLASRYAGEPVETAGELMEAAVGELLNVHNGVFLVNLSNDGIELELEPQAVTRGLAPAPADPYQAVIRVYGPDIQFDLMVEDLSGLV